MTELTDAIAHLEWFKIPHTIEDCCRIARDLARDDARIAASGRTGDGGSSGEISDPTGNAAVAGVMADDARDVAATILGALSTVEDETARLAPGTTTMPRKPGDGHTAPNARLSDVIADLHRLILNGAAFDTETAGYIRVGILEPAEWLHRKGEGLWAQARPGQREPAVQLPPKVCQSCARFGLVIEPELGRNECKLCRNHKSLHGCRPTERTCRRWDDLGVEDTLPREILAAKAAVSRAAGKSRKVATG